MNFDLLYSQNDNSEGTNTKSEFDEEKVSKDASKFFREIIRNTSSEPGEISIKSNRKGKFPKK